MSTLDLCVDSSNLMPCHKYGIAQSDKDFFYQSRRYFSHICEDEYFYRRTEEV